MKISEIKVIAKQLNLKPGRANKVELIRSVQQAEGNLTCFNSNSANECGQYNCLWRVDCA